MTDLLVVRRTIHDTNYRCIIQHGVHPNCFKIVQLNSQRTYANTLKHTRSDLSIKEPRANTFKPINFLLVSCLTHSPFVDTVAVN